MSHKKLIDKYTDRLMPLERVKELFVEGRNMHIWLERLELRGLAMQMYDTTHNFMGWMIKRGVSLPRKRKLVDTKQPKLAETQPRPMVDHDRGIVTTRYKPSHVIKAQAKAKQFLHDMLR